MHHLSQADGKCALCSLPAVVDMSDVPLCLPDFAKEYGISTQEAEQYLHSMGITVVPVKKSVTDDTPLGKARHAAELGM